MTAAAPHSTRPGGSARRWVVLAGLFLLAALLLSGCLGYQGDLAVRADDTVSGTVTVYKTLPDTSGAQSSAVPLPIPIPQPSPQTAPGESGGATTLDLPAPKPKVSTISVAKYQKDRSVGWTYTYAGASFTDAAAFAPLAERGGALMLTRDGDTVTLDAEFDLTYGTTTPAQGELITKSFTGTVTLQFPAEVTASNGTVEGKTVTWTLTALQKSSLTATVDYPKSGQAASASSTSAPASAASAESPLTRKVVGLPLWSIIVAGVVVLLVVGLLVGRSLRRRRREAVPAATPSGPRVPGEPADAARLPDRPGPIDARGPTWPARPSASSDTLTAAAGPPRPPVPARVTPSPDPAPPEPPPSPAPEPVESASEGTRPSFGPPLLPVAPPSTGTTDDGTGGARQEPAPPAFTDTPDEPVPVAMPLPATAGWPPPQPQWVDPQDD